MCLTDFTDLHRIFIGGNPGGCEKKMDLNDLTYKIRGAIFKVHSAPGPGLLESVYEVALVYELMQLGLKVA